MRSILKLAAVAFLLFGASSPLVAEDNMIGNFENQPESRWRFFADTVMGGASSGQVAFETDGEARSFAASLIQL